LIDALFDFRPGFSTVDAVFVWQNSQKQKLSYVKSGINLATKRASCKVKY
jgi:hypothetical protein